MNLFDEIRKLYNSLRSEKKKQFDRSVSLPDLLTDRFDRARFCGFGEGSSCYDNVLILGDVKVGKNSWIGPNTILDGQGGLEIGDCCDISAGVHIYTHHSIKRANSMHKLPIEKKPTKIGSGVYIGPNSVIQMGVTIGDRAIIGAMSFVNCDVPEDSKFWGVPARQQFDTRVKS